MKTKSVSMSKYIAFFSVILALTVVALTLPFVFLIPLLFVAVSFGFGITLITSLFFGLISLALSFAGGGFVPLAFIEQPLIPIVPRLIVGIAAYLVNAALNKLIKKEGRIKSYLPKVTAAAVGTIANTFFVVLFMYLFLPQGFTYGEDTLKAFTPVMITMGFIELLVNIVVLPPLAIAVNRALRLTNFGVLLNGQAASRSSR